MKYVIVETVTDINTGECGVYKVGEMETSLPVASHERLEDDKSIVTEYYTPEEWERYQADQGEDDWDPTPEDMAGFFPKDEDPLDKLFREADDRAQRFEII